MRRVALVVFLACVLGACGGDDDGGEAGSSAVSTTAGSATAGMQGDTTAFCQAMSELAADFGNLSEPTNEDVQRVQDKLTTIEVNAPAEVADLTRVMVADYRSVVDAFVTYNFDPQRVFNEAGPQVRSVLDRLAAASRTGEVVEPELTVFKYVSERCDEA